MKKLAWVLAVSMLSGCNPAMDEYSPRDFPFAGMSAAMDATGTVETQAPRRSEICRPAARERFD